MNPILFSILPLVSNENVFKMFQSMRRAALGGASAVPSLVMGIACLIIVFKLIKLTYQLESDEQQAGFGGVSLWQITRPVVILFALNIYPVIIGTVDGVANSVTTSIVSAADNVDSRAAIAARIAVVDAVTDEDKTEEETKHILENYMSEVSGIDAMGYNGFIYQGALKRQSANEAADQVLNLVAQNSEEELDARERRKQRKALRRWFSSYYKCDKLENTEGFKLENPSTWVPGLCDMIYDYAFVIIECGAEIILCILCFAGPVVLTVSLIDQYRHSFMEFIMRYFQFSFWKVVAAVINWAVQNARVGACEAGKSSAAASIIAVATGGEKAAGAASGALWLTALISLAGIFCFTKIGELAAYFIPVNGGGMASGAGAAVAAGAGAAAGASRAVSTAAGGVQNLNNMSSNKAQAATLQQIAGSVSQMASKEGQNVSAK